MLTALRGCPWLAFMWRCVGCTRVEEGEEELTSRLELLEKLIKASRSIAMKLDPFEGAL